MQPPDDAQWDYTLDGKTDGPFSNNELLTMLAWGTLNGDALIAPTGTHDWRPIGRVFPVPERTVATPAAPPEETRIIPPPAELRKRLSNRARTRVRPAVETAPFWRRAAAVVIDLILCGGIVFAVMYVTLMYILSESIYAIDQETLIEILLIIPAYEILTTASGWQGTPGKHWMRLRVMTIREYDITFLRSTWRWISKCIVGFGMKVVYAGILYVVFRNNPHVSLQAFTLAARAIALLLSFAVCSVVLVTPKARALHDYIAGTRVVLA